MLGCSYKIHFTNVVPCLRTKQFQLGQDLQIQRSSSGFLRLKFQLEAPDKGVFYFVVHLKFNITKKKLKNKHKKAFYINEDSLRYICDSFNPNPKDFGFTANHDCVVYLNNKELPKGSRVVFHENHRGYFQLGKKVVHGSWEEVYKKAKKVCSKYPSKSVYHFFAHSGDL